MHFSLFWFLHLADSFIQDSDSSLYLSDLLQVLLYDLRSSQPLLVKDHLYNLPINSLNFHNQLDLVVSSDSKIIKIWNKDTVSNSHQLQIIALSLCGSQETHAHSHLSSILYLFHRESCSPPYSLRPTSTVFASTQIQVRIKLWKLETKFEESSRRTSRMHLLDHYMNQHCRCSTAEIFNRMFPT